MTRQVGVHEWTASLIGTRLREVEVLWSLFHWGSVRFDCQKAPDTTYLPNNLDRK
jgi:hypothetical protein